MLIPRLRRHDLDVEMFSRRKLDPMWAAVPNMLDRVLLVPFDHQKRETVTSDQQQENDRRGQNQVSAVWFAVLLCLFLHRIPRMFILLVGDGGTQLSMSK